MPARDILTIRCYRQDAGDVDVEDVYYPRDPIEEASQFACNRLESLFLDLPGGSNPHKADMVTEKGEIIAVFEMRPRTTGGDECVEVYRA